MNSVSIRAVAGFLHPPSAVRRVIVVLRAYFDESGTHQDARATCLSGFVGDADTWDSVEKAWGSRLQRAGIPYFHYADFEYRKSFWEPMERWQRDPIREELAQILADSDLHPVSASYLGKWDPHLFETFDPGRYPNPYSFCFEACMEMVLKCSRNSYGGERVAVMFSRQEQYAPRALEYFGIFKHNDLWDQIVDPIAFGCPQTREALQAADMIAYENYQFLLGGRENFEKWPLLQKLWARSALDRSADYNIYHTEETLKVIIERGPMAILKKPTEEA